MTKPELRLVPRTLSMTEMVKACAEDRMSFEELCDKVGAQGFKTTSLHEMVRQAEDDIKKKEDG